MATAASLEGDRRLAELARLAAAVGRSSPRRKPGWPTLWLFTDPDRTPDVIAAASCLPRGSGVVLRTFGRPEAEAQAAPLADFARSRGLVLLVGADDGLAARIGAKGLHLPERLGYRLPLLRSRFPAWTFTVAAHGAVGLVRAMRLGADAAFLSAVFPSESPSAGAALGAVRAAELVRAAQLPVYALGGIDPVNAPRLLGSGFAGLAGVSFAQAEAGQPRT